MTAALFILAASAFLAFLALGAFAFLIVSIHRTPRVPMSETRGKRTGAFARCVIAGVRTESKEGDE
jgi:hypothetical protein